MSLSNVEDLILPASFVGILSILFLIDYLINTRKGKSNFKFTFKKLIKYIIYSDFIFFIIFSIWILRIDTTGMLAGFFIAYLLFVCGSILVIALILLLLNKVYNDLKETNFH